LTVEAINLFGWSVETILAMPAIRFFALLDEGRKQSREARAREHVAQCDIQSISLGNPEYFEKVRKVFYDRAMGIEGKPKTALDPTDPLTVGLVESLTLEASRVN
jgi:hypothetical protein